MVLVTFFKKNFFGNIDMLTYQYVKIFQITEHERSL